MRFYHLFLTLMSDRPLLSDHLTQPQTQRGIERRELILQTAYRLFLHHGYDNVCLDDVVQQAGGSKASVYKYFGNKEGLLFAICDYHFAEKLKSLHRPRHIDECLSDYLYELLLNAYHLIQQPSNIAFIHLILHQSKPNPAIVDYLNQKWLNSMQKNIQTILADAHQQQLLVCKNPLFSGLHFWGIVHDFHWGAILGKPPSITELADVEDYLRTSVNVFLQGHQYHKALELK